MNNKRKAMLHEMARVYGTTHPDTVRFATLCERYPNTEEYNRKIQDGYAVAMKKGPFIEE